MSSFSDADLVGRAVRQDQRAFGELVERHRKRIVRYLRLLLRDRDDAEDVAQEALARCYASLPQLIDRERFGVWATRIAGRLARNRLRDARTRRKYEERSGPLEQQSPACDRSDRQVVVACLEGLEPKDREILILYYVEEYRVADIQEHLGLGASATKMRLSRARRRFQERYDELTQESAVRARD